MRTRATKKSPRLPGGIVRSEPVAQNPPGECSHCRYLSIASGSNAVHCMGHPIRRSTSETVGHKSSRVDTEMFPGYVPGTTYYARYTWMDSKGAFDGWKGFIFSGDVADMAPIRMEYESPPSVKAETAASGTLSLDYLDGEIQNYTMSSDLSIDLGDVANVPFGEALICNIRRTGGTLTVSNGTSNQTYMENKTYMVVITNFGTPQIAVTETI